MAGFVRAQMREGLLSSSSPQPSSASVPPQPSYGARAPPRSAVTAQPCRAGPARQNRPTAGLAPSS